MKMETALQQAYEISYGTLASVSGIRSYDELDGLRRAFVGFIQESEHQFKNWMEAWEAFRQ